MTLSVSMLTTLGLALILASGIADAQPLSRSLASRVDSIFTQFNAPDAPGCALGIYRDGKLIYAKGYGIADLEHNVKITSRTMFDIGSTSKQFTAACLVLLAQQGKLSLDDDIRKYLPEIPDYGHTITIRHMLNHTSGLRDYLGLMLLAGADIDDVTSTAEALRLMARQKGLDFEPGAEHQYSNTGYFLASVIIQRASGRTLREFAAENIFKPLGMASTTYIDDHTAVLANRAIGYAPGEDGFHRDVSNWEQNGDGGVFTNVEDLLKWDENFYHPRVGGAGLPAELLRPGILNNGDTLDYALGLMHESLRGIPIVTHGGSWGGYRAELLRVPSEHFSVAVLGNVVTTNPSQLARMVAVTVLGDRLPPKAARTASPKRVAVAIAPETFDAYAGDYELDEEAGFVLSFRRDGSRFYVGATDQSELEIFPSSDSTYFPTSIDASFTFHHNASGELMVTLHQGGDHDAHRWVPYTLAPAKLPEYAGTYYSPELDIAVTIGSADSRVVATHGGLDSAALKPVGNDHFVGDLPYVNDVTFERNKDGRVMAMLITLARSKNLRFERKEGR